MVLFPPFCVPDRLKFYFFFLVFALGQPRYHGFSLKLWKNPWERRWLSDSRDTLATRLGETNYFVIFYYYYYFK